MGHLGFEETDDADVVVGCAVLPQDADDAHHCLCLKQQAIV